MTTFIVITRLRDCKLSFVTGARLSTKTLLVFFYSLVVCYIIGKRAASFDSYNYKTREINVYDSVYSFFEISVPLYLFFFLTLCT